MTKPRSPRKRPARTPMPGDDIRQTAQEALRQTKLLEEALKDNSLDRARDALEHGALPTLAHFSGKSGRPTSSAISTALKHPELNLDLVQLLLDYDAPLPIAHPGPALQAALQYDHVEVLPLLVQRVKPRLADWTLAISRPKETFLALDALVPMDRKKNLGSPGSTGYPPLFAVWDIDLARYLVETGAYPLQTPGQYAKNAEPGRANCTVISHLIEVMSQQWKNGTRLDLAPLIQYLHEHGVPLAEKDFQMAIQKSEINLLRYFISQGFRMTFSEPVESNFHPLVAYQTGLEMAKHTGQAATEAAVSSRF